MTPAEFCTHGGDGAGGPGCCDVCVQALFNRASCSCDVAELTAELAATRSTLKDLIEERGFTKLIETLVYLTRKTLNADDWHSIRRYMVGVQNALKPFDPSICIDVSSFEHFRSDGVLCAYSADTACNKCGWVKR